MKKPNIVLVLADQWRQQATGFNGDPNVKTPNLDKLAGESIHFTHAISGCPVCTPYRASLLTGQLPLTHGLFLNDAPLDPDIYGLGDAFADQGYNTAYIGKWHANGRGRENVIPKANRKGFDYWKVLECTHDYNHSAYYHADSGEKQYWEGYDVFAQTEDAQQYIQEHSTDEKPFLLVLSYGPPHDPYQTAPEEYQKLYDAKTLTLRDNVDVSPGYEELIRTWLAGYYAHCTAADAAIGNVLQTVGECGIDNDTIFIFTSDHGDMLGSHGLANKQQPYAESVNVPFLLRYPEKFGKTGRACASFIDAQDIMPTLLGLCDLSIPEQVEGDDISSALTDETLGKDFGIIASYHPFGQASVSKAGRAFRGIVTEQHTYVESLEGPWLFFDNQKDPCQQNNLLNQPHDAALRDQLRNTLKKELDRRNDPFENGMQTVEKWGYDVDVTGTLPV